MVKSLKQNTQSGMVESNETLSAIITAHIRECDARDLRTSKAFDEIKSYFKGIWDTIDKNMAINKADRADDQKDRETIKEDLKKLELRAAFFLGGLITLSKIFDYIFLLHK